MSVFERYLTIWVFLCIVIGIALGQFLPGVFQVIGGLSVAEVNLPVGILIWVMIIPDAGQGGFRGARRCAPAREGHWRDPVRELAGETFLDGAAGVAIHPPFICAAPAGGSAR